MTTEDVIRAALDAYARQDIDAALAHCSDDVQFTNQSAEATETWSFDCRNCTDFRAALTTINTEFEMLSYVLEELLVDGERAATRQNVKFRHRGTGSVLDTQTAGFWTVRGGKITSLHEFEDTAEIARHRTVD